jgi:hypothetical protein
LPKLPETGNTAVSESRLRIPLECGAVAHGIEEEAMRTIHRFVRK